MINRVNDNVQYSEVQVAPMQCWMAFSLIFNAGLGHKDPEMLNRTALGLTLNSLKEE